MTIEVKTPAEIIKEIRTKKEQRQLLRNNLAALRRERGLARVRWAQTRFESEEARQEVETIEALIQMGEEALKTL